MTGQLPQFGMTPQPVRHVVEELNGIGSAVLLMIETQAAVDDIEAIAATDGADVLLVGSSDLSIELGVAGDFRNERFQRALMMVAQACRKYGKILGLAGIYNEVDVLDWAVNELGVGFVLAQMDSGWLVKGCKETVGELRGIAERKRS